MRVLHLSAGNLYGGVETFLVTLARARASCPAMEPELAVCFPGRLRDEVAAAGVPVHDLGPARLRRPWTVVRARTRLARLLATARYDAVVAHMSWAQALFGGVVARRRVPLVAYFHGPCARGWEDRLAARQRPALVVGPSRDTVDRCRWLFPAARAEVLNYPLPPQVTAMPPLAPAERDAVRAGHGAGPGEVVVLHASRMDAWKGPDLTVKAVAGLRDVPGWRLWLAGGAQRPHEDELVARLKATAADAGVGDRVAFLGQRSDVPRLMRAADIYCQGNRGPEGFSLSFLEASYCRLPVVTTALGGAGEMIDETTGVLVPPSEDATALGDALRRLILDPARRAEMGERAHAKAVRLCDTGRQLGRLAGWLGELPHDPGAGRRAEVCRAADH